MNPNHKFWVNRSKNPNRTSCSLLADSVEPRTPKHSRDEFHTSQIFTFQRPIRDLVSDDSNAAVTESSAVLSTLSPEGNKLLHISVSYIRRIQRVFADSRTLISKPSLGLWSEQELVGIARMKQKSSARMKTRGTVSVKRCKPGCFLQKGKSKSRLENQTQLPKQIMRQTVNKEK